jgi:hypothetical protein
VMHNSLLNFRSVFFETPCISFSFPLTQVVIPPIWSSRRCRQCRQWRHFAPKLISMQNYGVTRACLGQMWQVERPINAGKPGPNITLLGKPEPNVTGSCYVFKIVIYFNVPKYKTYTHVLTSNPPRPPWCNVLYFM